MEFEYILCSKENGVLTITLNRPKVKNALSHELMMEVKRGIEGVDSDKEVRVVVLTGAGDVFSSGGDISKINNFIQGKGEEGALEFFRPFHEVVLTIYHLKKPSIAAINGPAIGAGFDLCLCCDFRIASAKALFSQYYSLLGQVPVLGGLYFLPRMVGLAKAYELILTGRTFSAHEALEMGLLNRVIPPDKYHDEVKKFAGYIASCATETLGLIKEGLRQALVSDLPSSLIFASNLSARCKDSLDFREGVSAIFEKRRPYYT